MALGPSKSWVFFWTRICTCAGPSRLIQSSKYGSPNPSTEVPANPFPFFQLPREIRDSIYYYALPRLQNDRGLYWNPYRAAEEPIHLFLVNRQFSREALELFYSTYPFQLPHLGDLEAINAALQDRWSPWVRSLITRINVHFAYFYLRDPSCFRYEEQVRQASETVLSLLPNLKRVVSTMIFVAHDIPEDQVMQSVARILKMASPFRGFVGFYLQGEDSQGKDLQGGENETTQQARVLREVREALGCQ